MKRSGTIKRIFKEMRGAKREYRETQEYKKFPRNTLRILKDTEQVLKKYPRNV